MTDNPTIERVARALALCAGGVMAGPGQSVASREFEHEGYGFLEKYAEAHWKEHAYAACFAIDAVTADERHQVALWMIEHGYATGHGDTVADMLGELEHQARGREVEAHEHETHIHRLAMTQLRETTSTLNSVVAARQRARIAAFKCVADWLETKAFKARTYPGGDLVHAKGRADAYGNAASEVRLMQHDAEEDIE